MADGIEFVNKYGAQNLVEAKNARPRRRTTSNGRGGPTAWRTTMFRARRRSSQNPHKVPSSRKAKEEDVVEWLLNAINITIIWPSGHLFVDNDKESFKGIRSWLFVAIEALSRRFGRPLPTSHPELRERHKAYSWTPGEKDRQTWNY